MARSRTADLTEYESHVLAIVAREQPTTAYKIRRIIESSPSAGVSSSAGAVYPIVARLKAKGYANAVAVHTDARNTELLMVTREGRSAIRRWIRTISPEQLLPEDPLRTRVAHADALTPTERLTWLRKVREALHRTQAEIDDYSREWPTGMIVHAHRNARLLTRARIAWIDELIAAEENSAGSGDERGQRSGAIRD